MQEYLLSEILRAAKNDTVYRECLRMAENLEPGFLSLRASLPPEQQDLLDRYIAACEAMDDALLAVAVQRLKEQ